MRAQPFSIGCVEPGEKVSIQGWTVNCGFLLRLTLTSRCTIRVGSCRPGGLAGVWLPRGGAVGDEPGDGQEGLVEIVTSSEVPLEGAPLLEFCVRVLDADPF